MSSKSRAKKIRREAENAGMVLPATTRQVPGSVGPKTNNSLMFKLIEASSLGIASILAYWFLTARVAGVTVSVLIDEYVYVLDAHYKAFTESGYPNHLFQLVYSTTKACGPQFYECARGINAAFVVASALVVYLLAVHLSKNKLLGAIAWVVTIAGTFGTYAAYFMPEAIFNFFMVLFIFGLVRFGDSDRFLVWLCLGVVLGVAAIAKPHAFFVVPAFVIYILISALSTKASFFRSSLLRVGAFLGALVASKLALGYLIAGPNGFNLFGSYGYAVSSGEAVAETLGDNTWLNFPETATGQTLMVVMILGVSLPVALFGLLQSLKKDEEQFLANKFRALFGIALLNMMAVSALFEAWQNLNVWMHTRYYSYLIPLAVVVLIEAYSRHESEKTTLTKRIIVGIFVVLSTYALFTQAFPFGANWIDAPDFSSHIRNIEVSSVLIVCAIGLAVYWTWNSKTSMAIAFGVSLFASVFAGWHITTFLNDSFGKEDTSVRTGRLLSNYLPKVELDKTALFGSDAIFMQRALFYSLSGGATSIGGTHREFDRSLVPSDRKWLVVYGGQLPELGAPHLTGFGYQLYSLSGKTHIVPRNNELASFTNACLEPENLDWVCGAETAIKVQGALPPRAKVDLIFDVDESAAGTDLEFSVGESNGTFTIPGGRFALSINFLNADVEQNLDISSILLDTKLDIEKPLIRLVSVNVY